MGRTAPGDFLGAPDVRGFLQADSSVRIKQDGIARLNIGGQPLLEIDRIDSRNPGQFLPRDEPAPGRKKETEQRSILFLREAHVATKSYGGR